MKNTQGSDATKAYEATLRFSTTLGLLFWTVLLGASLAWNILEPDHRHGNRLTLTYGLIWAVGLAAVAAFNWRGHRYLKIEENTVKELRLLASIFDEGSHAIMIAELDGKVFRVNPAFTQMTGYAADEVVGHHASFLNVPGHGPTFYDEIRKTVEKTGHWHGEIWNQHKDGTRFAVAHSISTVRDTAGNPLYHLCEMRNITQRKAHEEALLRLNDELEHRVERRTEQLLAAKQEAEQASQAKTEFLSRMSHELRTPLNAILGFSQLMLSSGSTLDTDQHENAEEILIAGQHLLELVNEVLDLARVESGHLELKPEPVAVADLVTECLALVRPLADERGISLDAGKAARCGLSCNIMVDRLRLRQALLNLLSNAIKYNRDGGRVDILCAMEQSHGSIRLGVSDTGHGIADEHMSRLFKPFERLDSAYAGIEGTGIGLALTQRIVHAMGGSLSVVSTPGQGTTFWIELPRANCIPSRGETA